MNSETKSNNLTARVCEVQRDLFTLLLDKEEIRARVKGTFYKDKTSFPVVGDVVEIQYNPYGDSIIKSIQERKSYFVRPDRGGHAEGYVKNLKEQPLIANFDYVFIVTSLNQNFNVNRIARYTSIVLQSGGKPVVILTKADLCSDIETYVDHVQNVLEGVDVIAISSLTGYGMEQLQPYLKEGITIAFLGSSGVGKSTLLNAIARKDIMKVNEIREEDGRGKHTTTHRQLVVLENGVSVIDTPGMREIGVCEVEEGIEDTFTEIVDLMNQCKFRNCSHTKEPGCAIRLALEDGTLSALRWELYMNLKRENTWAKSKKR